jgi:hypothetical protein
MITSMHSCDKSRMVVVMFALAVENEATDPQKCHDRFFLTGVFFQLTFRESNRQAD